MKRTIHALLLCTVIGLCGSVAAANELLKFDIAENGTRFSADDTPLDADGLPAYGNEFITEGYIYPHGTLSASNGVNADGTPEFPELVLGRWTCRGWHVGEGAKTTEGPWVVTNQIFDLANKAGNRTIVTEGFELPAVNVPIKRAITGGTGKYSGANGEQVQVMLGFPNTSFGVNLRVELKLKDHN